jgi:hypothetical protein
MAETEPGEVAQAGFGEMGLVFDPESGHNRVLCGLVICCEGALSLDVLRCGR